MKQTTQYLENTLIYLKKYSLFFILGLVTALSQAPLNIFLCSIIGFSGFFYLIKTQKDFSYFWAGHHFGFGYFLLGLHWVGNALLTDISQFGIFLPFAYLGLPFALGFFYAIACWVFGKILTAIPKPNHITITYGIFIITLALFDILRGYVFTGFPWNLPVYTTAFSVVTMQPSYLLGIYGYNFVWLLFAGSFSLYFFKPHSIIYPLSVAQIAMATSMCIYGAYHISTAPAKKLHDTKTIIRIIQPNIQQQLKWSAAEANDNFRTLLNLSKKNLKKGHAYIFVWPETALPFNPEYDFAAASQIIDLLDNKHSLVTGKMRFAEKPSEPGSYYFYNSLFKMTADGKIISVFDKVHLVPFGEYLPFGDILRTIGFSQINFFQSEFSAGKNFTKFNLNKYITASALICYEAIFPQYSKMIKQNGSDLIINVTNDAWFGDSFGPYQHLVQTQFRAVENNIPIIRSANTGISAFINKHGLIIDKIPFNNKGYIDIPSRWIFTK